eukprot:TRINITY_DN69899_c0_g1_i3.p1 TRINITY_DN69899_c0_g1~~TRINITY_DN69899_c0_g1_i3.p1  ORF type:complete len:106 (+),score=6.72 TRINITY_DN69899_c0_g1_i3:75-392(+)
MASSISKYFASRPSAKRKSSSTSSSDPSISTDSERITKSVQKKQKQASDSNPSSMAVQDMLHEMNKQIFEMSETLTHVATKDDIKKIREDMDKITERFTIRIVVQ